MRLFFFDNFFLNFEDNGLFETTLKDLAVSLNVIIMILLTRQKKQIIFILNSS